MLKIFITIVLLFLSPLVNSAEGDIYFCEMTEVVAVENHKLIQYNSQKFKFQRTSDKLIFGSEENTFQDYTVSISYSQGELFFGGDNYNRLSFSEGNFYYSRADIDEASIIAAKCSIF